MESGKIIEFLKTIEGLKTLERFRGQFFWRDYPGQPRYESVADHTWRMAMLLIVAEKYLSQPIDLSKTLKMTLIHDLPEIITGDLSPLGPDGTGNQSHLYNKELANKKHENEDKAAKEIFGKLPKEQGDELYSLWMEYEKQENYESKIVKAIDKIEGKLQAAEYSKGVMFKDHLDFSIKYGISTWEVDPFLKELGMLTNEELQKDFKEFKLE
jgi:putative hydrolase of HD superfamily